MNISAFHTTNFIRKYPILLTTIVLAIVGFACQQSVTNIELPYEDKIVIEGILEAGKPIQNISISHTLPPLGSITSEALPLRDAEILLSVDNVSYPPTVGQDSAKYVYGSTTQKLLLPVYNFGIVAQEGKTYTITVRWKGKTAQGRTTIPTTRNLAFANGYTYAWTTQVVPPGGAGAKPLSIGAVLTVEASVQVRPEQSYRFAFYAQEIANNAGGRVDTTVLFTGIETDWFVLPKGISTTTTLLRAIGSTSRFPALVLDFSKPQESLELITARVKRARYVAVLSIATSDYQQWFLTRNEGRSSSDPFTVGGQNIFSNITGEGIGIFTATASVEIPINVR
jgi:Domain of unknown function (DUF4249)